MEVALRSPLAVVDAADPPKRLLAENSAATYARSDISVLRVYPGTDGDRVTGVLHATRFGTPA